MLKKPASVVLARQILNDQVAQSDAPDGYASAPPLEAYCRIGLSEHAALLDGLFCQIILPHLLDLRFQF